MEKRYITIVAVAALDENPDVRTFDSWFERDEYLESIENEDWFSWELVQIIDTWQN